MEMYKLPVLVLKGLILLPKNELRLELDSYYDKEIITRLSKQSGLDQQYIETTMNHLLTFARSFTSAYATKTNLMVEEKKILEEIAKKGKDCVIVGRNADIILKDYQPFNIFVCANLDSKIQRCMERANSEEKLTIKDYEQKMKQIDQTRKKYRQIVTGKPWGSANAYHMTVNTSYWNIKELAKVVAQVITRYFA